MKNHRSDILFFFAVLLALWTAFKVRDVLMLIYVSALFAVVLSPAIGHDAENGSTAGARVAALPFFF